MATVTLKPKAVSTEVEVTSRRHHLHIPVDLCPGRGRPPNMPEQLQRYSAFK
jgi:hypothetical protein